MTQWYGTPSDAAAALDVVAIWAPNGLPWIVAALGTWHAGAVLVPINTRFKGHEAAEVLRRSRARVLVTASDFLGVDYALNSLQDGYTILFVGSTLFTVLPIAQKTNYEPLKDLIPVSITGTNGMVMVVQKDAPFSTLREFIDYARANPGKITYSSGGPATNNHLSTAYLAGKEKLDMVHVPYKGMGQVLTDAISGNIQMAFANTPNAAPLVTAGKLRAIAVAHPKRVPQLPDVPTVGEQGFPGFESNSGFIYFAPGETPPAVLDRLNAVFVEVLNLPEVKEALTKQGVEVMATSRADTLDFIKKEMKRYAEVVAFSGAKAE